MKNALALAIVIATMGTAGSASAAPQRPAWCDTEGIADLARTNVNIPGALKKDDPVWGLYYLVMATCSSDKAVDASRKDLDATRQYWSRKLDLTEADWTDVATWATADQGARYANLGTVRLPYEERKRAWSSYDPIDQYLAIAGPGSVPREDITYLTDALGANLSALGRFAFIEQCLAGDEAHEIRWAVCAPDIAALDLPKVAAELRAADKRHDGYRRTIIRLNVLRVRDALAEHAAAVKSLVSKDEAYGKLFEISAATRKEWDAAVAAPASSRPSLLALAAAMDDARITESRKALAGCEEKTWAAWAAAVSRLPPKSFDGLRDDPEGYHTFLDQAVPQLVTDPDIYLASLALVACRTGEEDSLASRLAPYVTNIPGFRGPRTAAINAMTNAAITLDDRAAVLRFPFADRSEWFPPKYVSTSGGSGKGVIASAKVDGKKVHITFVKKMEKRMQCAETRETNRITSISPDGTLRYQVICARSELVTINLAADPQDVDIRYAAGLKPGVYVSLLGDMVQAIWPKPSATQPSHVLGVPVK